MKKYLLLALMTFNAAAFDAAQTNALHNYVVADPVSQACIAAGDDGCLYNRLNADSTFVVWKTVLRDQDIYNAEGFNFTLVDGLTAGKRELWTNFIFKSGTCNPSKLNIRAGFLDVWSGSAPKTAVYNAILELSKRFATNAESVLATGTGSNAVPGSLTFEGKVSFQDIPRIKENN